MEERTDTEEELHLIDYIDILKKRRSVVIATFVVVVATVAFFSLRATPVYMATTQILIENNTRPVINVGESLGIQSLGPDYYKTQYNLLISRSLARQVIDRLGLRDVYYRKAGQDSPGLLSGIAAFVGAVFREDSSLEEGERLPDGTYPADDNAVVDWYIGNLSIKPVRGSQLVDISFLSSSPELSSKVVNAHAEAYIKNAIQASHASYASALEWLRKELKRQKSKLEESRKAVYEYKRNNDIVTLQDREDILSQGLVELNSVLTKTKAERVAKQTVYNQLLNFSVSDESIFSLPEVSTDPVIQNLRSQLLSLKAKRLEMGTNFGPRHPKMMEVSKSIGQLEQELKREVMRLSLGIKADLDRALSLEKSLQSNLDEQKMKVLSLNKKAIPYEVLLKDVEVNQSLYDLLLKQYSEISLKNAMESSNIKIVDRAEVPLLPVKPKLFQNILLAVVLGIFLGPGTAFFFEYMDDTAKSPEDISRRLSMNVLGMLPYNHLLEKDRPGEARTWDEFQRSKPALGYIVDDISGSLATTLNLTGQSSHGTALVMESAVSGEGKSTVLTRAAVSLARGGLRVLMVDADPFMPSLAEKFALKGSPAGLSRAVDAVVSQQLVKGDLQSFSMDDIFFLIELKRLNGKLTVQCGSQQMNMIFSGGRLVHMQGRNSPLSIRLGTMLLKGGLITREQLDDALERNSRTGQPLGYILVNSGYITPERLRGPLKLQMEEHLQKLFTWKHGEFTFDADDVHIYSDDKVCFAEDYTSIVQRLSRISGSRYVERVVLSKITTVDQGLWLLPSKDDTDKPAMPVYLNVFRKFLDILKTRFDIILIDLPPVLEAPGAVPMSTVADGAIFVVKAGNLSVRTLNRAASILKKSNIKIIGAVLNQAKINSGYYY